MTTLKRFADGRAIDWAIEEADEKLAFRASLPGAFGWDQAAHVLRVLQSEGVHGADLLPLAFPTSWMVNARATSRAFQKWLLPPADSAWEALLDAMPANVGVQGFRELDRAKLAEHVATLASVEGAGLAAVTKVLALLRPQVVPLMDDAAISFALGTVPMPEGENGTTAGAEHFLPMMEWFTEQVSAGERELIAIAARHRLAVLDAAQVLDRLLWVDSYGKRYRAGESR